ncbi:MAG TPA: endonuclease/exonuclease/phosphatase family protein [Mucilaginibacter sp.]|nr:endonuclease/exonuclease/phosphatase family protein [Mucilaginibacter sp.]
MKLVTWNMQGSSHSTENKWNTGVMNFFGNGADICCLQECGAVPASARLINPNYNGVVNLQYYTWGTNRTNKHILFYQSDPNGNRCNLAIVSTTPPVGGGLVMPGVAPVWRPALGFQINPANYVFSLHAISPNGPDAANLLAAINNTVGAPGNFWVAAGDYNRAPSTLLTPFTVCPPNNNTYSVTAPTAKLDYCSKNFGVPVTGIVQGLILSDHYPMYFTI